MIKMNTMTIKEFFDSHVRNENGQSKEIVERFRKEYPECRVSTSEMPLYKGDSRILGGGECEAWITYRRGYGYTCIHVGDRGYWICYLSQNLSENEITFCDGDFEEVCTELSKYIRY